MTTVLAAFETVGRALGLGGPGKSTALQLALAFLIGSIPFGLILGRVFFRTDIRGSGSGNIGAANALRTFGRGAGIAVLVLDALKGAVPVLLGLATYAFVAADVLHTSAFGVPGRFDDLVRPYRAIAPLAGLVAVIGHCYSPWLRFKGGKGVATFLGATIALSPTAALAFAAMWAAVALPTGFASAASLAATIAAGMALVLLAHGAWPTYVYAVGCAAVIFWRHRENIERLRTGTETKTDLFKKRG